MPILDRPFGLTTSGEQVRLFTLTNAAGTELSVMTYGATWTSLRTRDRAGQLGEILLGYDTLEPYLTRHPYFGSVVGRFANRIAFGRFELDGQEHLVTRNDGPHHLHGGARGFDSVVWEATVLASGAEPRLTLRHVSPSGTEGYPGDLEASVTYALSEDDAVRITFEATASAPTLVNLAHHAYFNLANAGTVIDHVLCIPARFFLPVDETLIPTGCEIPVFGTPFDFRTPRPLGSLLESGSRALAQSGGYDHTFVLAPSRRGLALALAAEVSEPRTRRRMRVYTTQPGVHLYSGNFLDGSWLDRYGRPYLKHAGFCLETQHFPDSPNRPAFPTTVLRPGERYAQTTELRFDTT